MSTKKAKDQQMMGLSLNLMSCLQDLDKDLDEKHGERLQGFQNQKLSKSYKLNINEPGNFENEKPYQTQNSGQKSNPKIKPIGEEGSRTIETKNISILQSSLQPSEVLILNQESAEDKKIRKSSTVTTETLSIQNSIRPKSPQSRGSNQKQKVTKYEQQYNMMT